VLQLLVRDRVAEARDQLVVGRTVAHRRLEVPLAAREEAGAELTVGGESNAVARRAERLRDRIDEPDLAVPVGERVTARGRRRLRRQLDERPVLGLDQRSDLGAGQHLVVAPALVRVERHELDEADDVRLASRERGEARHLFLGEALDRDRVDLDGPQLGVALRFLEPAQHLVEGVAPRQLGEAHVVERVERHVHAPQSRVDERTCQPVEQHAVRRQREVADAVDLREHPDEHRQVTAHERLAARQTHLVHAEPREDRDEARDLLEAQNLVTPEPLEPFRRHAVRAAEVALVGDGDADALDLAAPAVDERLHALEPSRGFRGCAPGEKSGNPRERGLMDDGRKDQATGKLKEYEGKVTGDETREAQGKAEHAKGDAKEKLDDLKDKVSD
jgi:uncharacterized protein YjbJ (UPF0337 family)